MPKHYWNAKGKEKMSKEIENLIQELKSGTATVNRQLGEIHFQKRTTDDFLTEAVRGTTGYVKDYLNQAAAEDGAGGPLVQRLRQAIDEAQTTR